MFGRFGTASPAIWPGCGGAPGCSSPTGAGRSPFLLRTKSASAGSRGHVWPRSCRAATCTLRPGPFVLTPPGPRPREARLGDPERGSALIYADSSAIVKRYYAERGSDLLKSRWVTLDRIFTSRVAYAEIHAALARKARDGELSRDSFRTAAAAFEHEWLAYDHILVDEATLKDVRSLVRRHSLRGFDAVHLSAALWLREELRTIDRVLGFGPAPRGGGETGALHRSESRGRQLRVSGGQSCVSGSISSISGRARARSRWRARPSSARRSATTS